jgi:hypothetical protein
VSAFAACLLICGTSIGAEAPVPPVTGNTLWHWLGIPQGYNKVRDARVNKNGNRPENERQLPLKRIADPANLESENPAIKAAAKIKAEEDLAPQKIKAIKYLGTVGCGCYPGVRESLLAALDDCTEEVRYEAALALCQVAGNPCKNCDKSGCCNAEVMNKLNDVATGQDAKGCWKESSSRVRAAACNALNACRLKNPTTPMQPIPDGGKELPVEGTEPGSKELPSEPGSNGRTPTPAPLPPSGNQRYAPQSERVHLTGFSRDGEQGVSVASDTSPGMATAASSDPNAEGVAQQVAFLRWGERCRRPCPQICPEQTYPAPQGETVTPGETLTPPTGPEAPSETPVESAIPPSNALASNYGSTSGPLSSAPNMIGDFFGGAGVTYYSDGVNIGSAPLPGNSVSRFKMAENTSPLPQDRIYFDFSSFTNVPLLNAPSSVNSYAFGFEKTFFDGIASVELRAPMATTVSNDIYFNNPTATSTATGEFGNMALAFKTLLLRREKFLLSGGLALTLPTAQNSYIFANQFGVTQTPSLLIENQSVHLMPFFGGIWTPNDRWFGIGYLQVDVDGNGNAISGFDPFVSVPTEEAIGRYYDTTFLYADLGVGYWAKRSNDHHKMFTGLAYVLEFHFNQSLQGQQVLNSPNFQIGTPAENVSFTDMTVGAHLELYKLTTITASIITPLTSDGDRQFDSQFRLFVNRRF